MKNKSMKITGIISSLIVVMAIALTLCSCGINMSQNTADEESREVVVVIPTDGKSTITSLISDYEQNHPEISIKTINIGGTAEEIHRFCVSTLMDSKFSADLLIIDDVWLAEFADSGLVSEVADVAEYQFVPAAESKMKYNGKIYGIPVYADAMATFKKYESSSGESVYFEESANDTSAYIRGGILKGASKEDAFRNYLGLTKIDNLADFVDSDAETMHGWISRFDAIQKYYPKFARKIKIDIPENSLIKTRLAIINSNSQVKDEALEIVKYLLADSSQTEIMQKNTCVPVLHSHYSDPVMLDRFPYLAGISGTGFGTFPHSRNYNSAETNLAKLMQTETTEALITEALEFLEK